MNIIRIRDNDVFRPLHVVLMVILLATVGGSSLLLSAAESATPIDGAIEWSMESPLRAVVQLLCLNYAYPTIHAGDVKAAILGFGAGLAMLAFAVSVAMRRAGDEDVDPVGAEVAAAGGLGRVQLPPVVAAQILFGTYLVWSFASAGWSAAPRLAIGGSIILLIQLLWALAMGVGLPRRGVRVVAWGMFAIGVITAAAAIWYFYGRNPTIRAKFPSGNPNFLAANLIPAMLLGIALIGASIGWARAKAKKLNPLIPAVVLVSLAICVWAFKLADSRGAQFGLIIGGLSIACFLLRGRWRLAPLALIVLTIIALWTYYNSKADTASLTGRSATIRFRSYAWSYAWRLFEERPLLGHGQSGYVLLGDSKAIADVESDPQVFEARIAHAHSEWLEVLADLGSIGFVLLAGALLMTFCAGVQASAEMKSHGDRWLLAGCFASLAGLCVSECFGVGLRVGDVPTFFYTSLGLCWAISSDRPGLLAARLSRSVAARWAAVAVAAPLGLGALVLSQADFASARSAYRVDDLLDRGDLDAAVEQASRGVSTLNADRALANLLRLGKAHMRAAGKLLERAEDREARAHATDVVDQRLVALADDDRQLSQAHLVASSQALEQLQVLSPNYFNYGRVWYGLNLIGARHAAHRGDQAQRDQFISAAADALGRELLRQPFDPALAVEFVRLTAGQLDLDRVLHALARPLRLHRLNAGYFDLLTVLAGDPQFAPNFEPFRSRAENPPAPTPDAPPDPLAPWAPEVLRLSAAVSFASGDYAAAKTQLEHAIAKYEPIEANAGMALASVYAELADSCFFLEPADPSAAIKAAERSLAKSPDSLPGRSLGDTVRSRLVDYWLAAGDESRAAQALRATVNGNAVVDDRAVQRELGSRYARIAYSMLQRPIGGVLRQPAAELRPKLDAWVARALELTPEDYLAHYLSADLQFLSGNPSGAAASLRTALQAGLPLNAALQFLQVALSQNPDNAELAALQKEIVPEGTPAGGAQPVGTPVNVPSGGPPTEAGGAGSTR